MVQVMCVLLITYQFPKFDTSVYSLIVFEAL